MSLNFGQIQSLTSELVALERLKNQCLMLLPLYCLHLRLDLLLEGNEGIYKVSVEFEIRSDPTKDYGVSCL